MKHPILKISGKTHYFVFALILTISLSLGLLINDKSRPDEARGDILDTTAGIGNESPVITATVGDDSSVTSKTIQGNDVTFTATAKDINAHQYYLAICKTDAVTVGNDTAPTCDGGEWGISSATNSNAEATATYTTSGGDAASNDWYAFVCDKVIGGGVCYPGNGSGDQGSAVGTITFSGVPVDGATLTIDGITYEFDTANNGNSSGTEVDTSSSDVAGDAAFALTSVEAGTGSSMVARGSTVYVYADSAGVAGNSIAMAEAGDTGDLITLSGANLTGGSDDNASPFVMDQFPTFGTVTVTDINNGTQINPGDTLRFTLPSSEITDDSNINMYICTEATTAFNYTSNTCTDGTLICSDTGVDPDTEDATCDETGNTLALTTDTRGTESFKVYVEDDGDQAATGTNAQTYDIINTAPTHDDPEMDVHAALLPNSVGYWQFEDGSGATSFDDETSNGNDATCTGGACPTWTDGGYSGGAYDFDGAEDYLKISNVMSAGDNFTATVWFKTDTCTTEQRVINANAPASGGIGVRVSNTCELMCSLDQVEWCTGSDTITADTWHFVALVRNGSDIMLYHNGDSTPISTSTTAANEGNDFYIGSWKGDLDWFNGLIDEPHIYNRALTADEISQIYSAYAGPPEADLVSHWSFNDGPDGYTQVMDINQEGTWDTGHANLPTVLKDGSIYKMWYSGQDSTNWRILYATSNDGFTWSAPVRALDYNQEGTWDTTDATTPTVIKDGDVYKMWYTGRDVSSVYRILYTTSTDGINWTTPQQALNINQEGSWDTSHVYGPTVIKDGSTFKMWFSGSGGASFRILYTTSTDGVTWATPVQALANNVEGSWDTVDAYSPTVIKDGDMYKMWYTGSNGSAIRILYTTSTDGINWTTPQQALNINQEGNWDADRVGWPTVIKEGNAYRMWYGGYDVPNYRILHTKINYDDEFGENDAVMGGGVAPTLATGYYGKAVDFNGTTEYINASSNPQFLPDAGFTIAGWVYVEGNTGSRRNIYYESDSNQTERYWNTIDFSVNPNEKLRLYMRGDNPQNAVFNEIGEGSGAESNTALSQNQWHHVVAVWDGNNAQFYLNGEADGTVAKVNSFTKNQSDPDNIYIGAFQRGTDAVANHFNGLIDEVRTYDAALDATEIQQLYYASKYHDSNQDLSCKALNIADHDSDTTTTIFNWLKDDTPITVLSMPFDSNVSSTTADAVLDYSGNANHGTLAASTATPTWTSSGVKGGAYDFDGTDDYIEISDSPNIEISPDMTLEAWVNLDDFSEEAYILERYDWSVGNRIWRLRVNANGSIFFYVDNDGTGYDAGYGLDTASSLVSTDTWHHIVATKSGTTCSIYLDGDLKASESDCPSAIDVSRNQAIAIGKRLDADTPEYLDGTIDEVKIYNIALSAEQIAQNYNNGIPNYSTIVNQETAEGDVSWQCEATVNDLQTENTDSVTNSLGIISPNNSAPVQAVPSSRAHALLDANSVGYWQFEGGDLTSNILDETTNSNDGSCTNCPTWTSEGAIGGGYEFDGTDDYIEIPDSANIEISTDMTLSAWVNLDDFSEEAFILERYNSTGNNRIWRLRVNTNGSILFYVDDDGTNYNAGYELNTASSLVSTDTWHHIVATKSGTTCSIYLDGDLKASESDCPSTIDVSRNQVMAIGKRLDVGSEEYIDGTIDEPHIYDRALTATEIADLYNSTTVVYDNMDLGIGTRDIADADADDMYATVDWRESDTSIAVLNMSFNESVTSTAADAVLDYSTYANHGQLGAGFADFLPTWSNATTCGNDTGGCYSFDGNDLILLPPSEFLNDDTTATMWFKTSSTELDVALWIGKYNDPDNRFIIYFPGDGKVGTYIKNASGTVDVYSNSTVNDGNWHYLAAINDGTGSSIYIDGVKQTDVDATVARLSQIATPTTSYIGFQHLDGAEYRYNGYLDEIRIYDRALTAEQITANYNAGKPNHQGIAYGETSIGETWSAHVTLTEGNSESSTTIESNDVEILGFSVAPSDGGSSATTPTNTGSDVTFTATANVANGNQYYLAICKTDAVTAGDDAAPTCDGGSWAISTATNDNTEATAGYTITGGDSGSNTWYAFACDKVAGGGACSTSAQGSGDNGSPFVVNQAPVIGDVSIGDTSGGGGLNPATGSATIDPGDTVYFNAAITDADTSTIDMYVCDSAGFTYGASPSCTGTELCNVTGVNHATDFAECGSATAASVPTAHGTYTAYIYTQDSGYGEGTGTNNHDYDVQDVPPSLTGYVATDVPTPPAGGSDTVDFIVNITDDNGDGDVTSASGVFFDDSVVDNTCTADENECYLDADCTLTNVSTPGSGKTATGTDAALTANCQVTVWFNANASDWDVNATATDGTGSTQFGDAGVSIGVVALQGVDIVEGSISYGAVEIGGTSVSQEVSLGNVGNQSMDLLLQGTDMCIDSYSATCPAEFIPRSAQRWHLSDTAFDWDASATGDGPYPLIETANTTGGNTGCINHTIQKRDNPASNAETNQSLIWKLRIPDGQKVGSYYGEVTVQTTSGCVPETCDNASDDDGDGRVDCADHHDCDYHPHCMELSLRMRQADHDSGNNRTLDQSENLLHAIFGDGATSSTFPSRIFKPGYTFDGGDYMTIDDDPNLETAGAHTVMFWFRPQATKSHHLVSKYRNDTPTEDGWVVTADANGAIKSWIKNDASSGDFSVTTADSFYNLGNWYHVAVTWDTGGGTMKLYVDGALQDESAGITGTFSGNSRSMLIGNSWASNDVPSAPNFMEGSVADVKYFDYEMNIKQIRNLFHQFFSVYK